MVGELSGRLRAPIRGDGFFFSFPGPGSGSASGRCWAAPGDIRRLLLSSGRTSLDNRGAVRAALSCGGYVCSVTVLGDFGDRFWPMEFFPLAKPGS